MHRQEGDEKEMAGPTPSEHKRIPLSSGLGFTLDFWKGY